VQTIDPQDFLDVVKPELERGDADSLARAVAARWTPRQVARLLREGDPNARRAAAMVLGLIGDVRVAQALTRALRDPDAQVNRMAEHSLWAIWFRSGNDAATAEFRRGVAALSEERFDDAAQHFRAAATHDPTFTEAYNQCAIAHYLAGRWLDSLRWACAVIKRLPTHFGALAGMGHCYAQLGRLDMALRCYRHAVRVNPHLQGVAQAIRRLEAVHAIERKANDLSGEYSIDRMPV